MSLKLALFPTDPYATMPKSVPCILKQEDLEEEKEEKEVEILSKRTCNYFNKFATTFKSGVGTTFTFDFIQAFRKQIIE